VVRDLIVVALTGLCPECRVVTAGDGLSALAAFEAHRPRLVLLDLLLPRLNGLDVLRQMQAQAGRGRRVPVIIISALGLREVVAQTAAANACDFILKPFDPIVLADKVRAALARPEAAVEP
jgi:DNA-binding response OmpR family regulator